MKIFKHPPEGSFPKSKNNSKISEKMACRVKRLGWAPLCAGAHPLRSPSSPLLLVTREANGPSIGPELAANRTSADMTKSMRLTRGGSHSSGTIAKVNRLPWGNAIALWIWSG